MTGVPVDDKDHDVRAAEPATATTQTTTATSKEIQ